MFLSNLSHRSHLMMSFERRIVSIGNQIEDIYCMKPLIKGSVGCPWKRAASCERADVRKDKIGHSVRLIMSLSARLTSRERKLLPCEISFSLEPFLLLPSHSGDFVIDNGSRHNLSLIEVWSSIVLLSQEESPTHQRCGLTRCSYRQNQENFPQMWFQRDFALCYQVLDHFTATDGRSWNQRYWENLEFYQVLSFWKVSL